MVQQLSSAINNLLAGPESDHPRDAACTAANIGISRLFCDGCTCATG
jgi:hypothetical protein